jgi:hypothetical protein
VSVAWILAGAAVGLPVAYGVWRLTVQELGSQAAALVTAVLSFVALAVFPDRLATVARDAQTFRELSDYERVRWSGRRVIVDSQAFDALRERIPPGATYYLQVEGAGGRPVSGGVFRHWALGWLLPRTAVASPDQAEWVIAENADPRRLDVDYESVERIAPDILLGRVRP